MTVESVPVENAVANMDYFLELVTGGKEVVLTRDNVAVARLLPPEKKQRRVPEFGTAAGQVWIADDFDEIPEGFEEYV